MTRKYSRRREKGERIEDWFWLKVRKLEGEDACWIWEGTRNTWGYGIFRDKTISRKDIIASRYVWEMMNGRQLRPGMQACHHCDNPPCVRPDHLFEGTAKDNAQDSVNKGRSVKGERQWKARLKDEQAKEARKALQHGMTRKKASEIFKVSYHVIQQLAANKSYRNVGLLGTVPYASGDRGRPRKDGSSPNTPLRNQDLIDWLLKAGIRPQVVAENLRMEYHPVWLRFRFLGLEPQAKGEGFRCQAVEGTPARSCKLKASIRVKQGEVEVLKCSRHGYQEAVLAFQGGSVSVLRIE